MQAYGVLLLCAKFYGLICHTCDVFLAVSRSETLIILKRAPEMSPNSIIDTKNTTKYSKKNFGTTIYLYSKVSLAHKLEFSRPNPSPTFCISIGTNKFVNRGKSK
jgi:hypothetical protein